MKILQISPYATCNDVPLLSQCKAGFGYMVYDIAKSLAKNNEVEMILFNYRYKKFEKERIVFRESKIRLFLKNVFYCSKLSLLFYLKHNYHVLTRTFIRLFYIWFATGYYYKIIRNGHYDVVHIHGCGFYDDLLMDVCRRLNQPFVITLHGLNSFSDSIKISEGGKRYERDFLQRVANGEFSITVISSGIKRTIEKTYGITAFNNIHVVCNAFTFAEGKTQDLNIREIYGIPGNSKLLLYVGNINKNKNQEQLIEAFDLLPDDVVKDVYVLFLGRNNEPGYEIETLINKSQSKEHLILCGNIDKEQMPGYYQNAEAVALLSKAEGFGLSLIEGMHFGLPCMTFCDLDAFNDIYDPCAVVALPDRNNQTVAHGLMDLLYKEWNSDEIMHYSQKFESKSMADNYLDVYLQIQ